MPGGKGKLKIPFLRAVGEARPRRLRACIPAPVKPLPGSGCRGPSVFAEGVRKGTSVPLGADPNGLGGVVESLNEWAVEVLERPLKGVLGYACPWLDWGCCLHKTECFPPALERRDRLRLHCLWGPPSTVPPWPVHLYASEVTSPGAKATDDMLA